MSAAISGVWGSTDSVPLGGVGSSTALESDKETIIDLLLTWDPSDNFSAWVNADWRNVELDPTCS